MKNRIWEITAIVLFCAFLLSMTLGYLLLPKTEFSQREKRYLAEAPALSWRSLTSGDWANAAEDYMADHIPGRDFFVGLNAYFTLATGRQAGQDIQYLQGRLVEAPVVADTAAVARKMAILQKFTEITGQGLDLMIIPSAGWALTPETYPDAGILADIYAQAGTGVHPVDVSAVFENRPELYYRTDHHWTSEGAWAGYSAYMAALGQAPRDDFSVTQVPGFQGSTYSRSALWLTPAETLELWQGSKHLTVTTGEDAPAHDGIFYPHRLEEADKYTVFLDGNHPLVRIRNPEKTGRLLVIRDSYANCLGGFLAESYAEVVLLDLRYYRSSVSQLVKDGDFDRVLVCYSIGNFLTDTNFSWLR